MPNYSNFSKITDSTGNSIVSDVLGGLKVNLSENTDMFGDLVAGPRWSQFEINHSMGADSTLLTPVSSGVGGLTYGFGGATIFTGASASSSENITSVQTLEYRVAHEWFIYFTASFTSGAANSHQRIGLYNGAPNTPQDGFFIGYEGTVWGISQFQNSIGIGAFVTNSAPGIAKSAMNGDPLTGAANSDFTSQGAPVAWNPQNINIYRLRGGWLGAGVVVLEVLSPDGVWVAMHTFHFPNSLANSYTWTTNWNYQAEVFNSTNNSNLVMYLGGASFGTTDPTYRMTDPINGTTLAQTTRSALFGQYSNGTANISTVGSYGPLQTDANLNLKISDTTLAAAMTPNNSNIVVPSLVVVGGQTNDTVPVYAEQPLSQGGASLLTSTLDNTVLDNKSNISVAGAGSTYTCSGYQTISFQFGGLFDGTIYIEGSNDGTFWFRVPSQHLSSGIVSDVVLSAGVVLVAASTKYIRYNIQFINGSTNIVVIGKAAGLPESPLVPQSLDSSSGVQLNTNIINLNRDANNALIASDAPAPIYIGSGTSINGTIIIDTQGYQSLNITTEGMAASVTASNDKITWSALSGTPLVLGTLTTTVAANSGYSFPCVARYIRFTITTVGAATVYLRNQPWIGAYTTSPIAENITQVGSSAIASAGVSGLLSTGGPTAVGSAPGAAYPTIIGSIDPSGLIRRVQSDIGGRLNVNSYGVDSTGNIRIFGATPPTGSSNLPSVLVQDTTQFEGSSQIELLGLILQELRINSYYLFNMASLLNTGTSLPISDEPIALRNEPSILTQGQGQ